MKELQQHFPIDFPRRCRGFDDFDRWKATELRQFFLYIGPVILKEHLTPEVYDNFMYFSVLSYIGSNNRFCKSFVSFLQEAAKYTVQEFAKIFGEQHVVYNIHNFIHLFDNIEQYGSLDNYSCFPFESYLGKLKKLVRGCQNPAAQIFRRLKEEYTYDVDRNPGGVFEESRSRSIVVQAEKEKSVISNNTLLSPSTSNRSIIINRKPAFIVHFHSVYVFYQTFKDIEPFYSLPIPSNRINVYKCSRLSNVIHKALISDIFCKCFGIPFNDEFVFIPLLHTIK